MMTTGAWNVVEGLKPAMLMVIVQLAFAGLNVLYKLSINDGMNLRVMVAYRLIFATLFLTPLALIVERGVMSQNLYSEAMALVSATFVSAMNNLLPTITFIMAISLRLERLNLRTKTGKAKIIGTIIGISGAMILTFFKGAQIDTGSFHVTLMHHLNGHVASPQSSSGGNTLFGALCALGSCITYALWLIIQTKMSKSYPCHYSSTALMSFMGSLLSSAFALCFDRDWTQWKLGWNVRLLSATYSGIIVSGAMVVVVAWCAHMRGPLYVSAFSPLSLVIVALAGSFIFDEKLHLGSIIGGLVIMCGLYVVLWGKDKEIKQMNQVVPSENLDAIIVTSLEEDKNHNNNNNNNCDVEEVRNRDHSSGNGGED